MKQIMRSAVAWVVRIAVKHLCKTYGDIAEMSPGPCTRCVGMEVRGAK